VTLFLIKKKNYIKTLSKEEVKEELDMLEGSIGSIIAKYPIPLYILSFILIRIFTIIPVIVHLKYSQRKTLLNRRLKKLSKKKMKAMVTAGEAKKVGFKTVKTMILKQIQKPKVWKSLTAGVITMVVIGTLIKIYQKMGNKKAVAELEKANKKLELKR
jgi:hypothetical protein